MHVVWVFECHVEVREQLSGVSSLLPPCVSQNQTQVFRASGSVPNTFTTPSHITSPYLSQQLFPRVSRYALASQQIFTCKVDRSGPLLTFPSMFHSVLFCFVLLTEHSYRYQFIQDAPGTNSPICYSFVSLPGLTVFSPCFCYQPPSMEQ